MKDHITQILARYTVELTYDKVPQDVVEETKVRVLDSIGVAVPAVFGEPVYKTRRILLDLGCNGLLCAEPILYPAVVPLEWACMTSSLMVRYLDFNDTYLSKEPLHPSDMIGGLLTLAGGLHRSGKDLITSIALAYEIGCRLCDCGSLRVHGWDHVNYILVAMTLAAGKLMNLDESQLSEALSIAVVSHASMRQARVGELSHWKAYATADAVRHSVFSCILAKHGVTGPDKPFTGEMGFIKQLLSNEFDDRPVRELENIPPPKKVRETIVKHFPVEIHSQTAVEAAQEIRRQVEIREPDDIKKIEIYTFRVGYEIIARDPEKWDPKTKETADHSLPWITATALLEGEVWLHHYEPDRIRDPRVLSLLKRTEVKIDPEIDKLYPEAIPNRVVVRLRDGKVVESRVDSPLGHPRRPMSWKDVESKFRRLVSPYMTKERVETVIQLVKSLENIDDVYELIDALRL